jgi:hypothetical protein
MLAAFAMPARQAAQDKPKAEEHAKAITPLKVQVVLAEYEGEKKVGSLPYAIHFTSREDRSRGGAIRMGVRIPVSVGSSEKGPQVQYVDVGTNIDCSAQLTEGNRYRVEVSVERSSIYTAGSSTAMDWKPGDQTLSSQPIMRQVRAVSDMIMRDGQTIESTLGTDPLTGHVWKAEVTLTVLK